MSIKRKVHSDLKQIMEYIQQTTTLLLDNIYRIENKNLQEIIVIVYIVKKNGYSTFPV